VPVYRVGVTVHRGTSANVDNSPCCGQLAGIPVGGQAAAEVGDVAAEAGPGSMRQAVDNRPGIVGPDRYAGFRGRRPPIAHWGAS